MRQVPRIQALAPGDPSAPWMYSKKPYRDQRA